jgi:plasmid stabilization system protein ParE
MTYKVRLTKVAADDVDEAFRWIAEDAPEAADEWYEGLLRRIQLLKTLPTRCPLIREAPSLRRDVRQFLYGKHRILFVIAGANVLILRVWHGARRSVRRSDLKDDTPGAAK